VTRAAIARVDPHEAAGLARLERACFDAPWDQACLEDLLTGDLTHAWRLHVGDDAVAYVIVRVVAGEGEILRVGVLPGHRRQGLAATLLQYAMHALSRRLTHGLHLEVRAANAAARALYARLGFVESGLRTGYYAAPADDAVLMRWAPRATA
jgi:ribosomal-protein-alanine N-acetyltransferase